MRSLGLLLAGVSSVALSQSPAGDGTLRGLDRFMPPPALGRDNQNLIELGRRLFFDPILSVDSSVSCATCHKPARSFADGRSVSLGVSGRRGTRNVPSIINRGWGRAFFWDGRITVLEDQVLRPIEEPTEMGSSTREAVRRLARYPAWQSRFRSAAGEAVSRETLARALAAYVRSIRAGESPFDRAMLGDARALTPLEQQGLELFQGRARCTRCHSGALLTDESFHNTGVAWRNGAPTDSGRAIVTRRSIDVGSFKTPTLRQIGLTAPYMHDGSLQTLDEVVAFYDKGGHPNPNLDAELHPLGLSASEKDALLAFLTTVNGRLVEGMRNSGPCLRARSC